MADTWVRRGAANGLPQPSTTVQAVSPLAAHWLADLPEAQRPRQTAERFPHIINMLSARWTMPAACRAYFEELLLDNRGGRQGFPPKIALELAGLKDYYESVVHPVQQTAWDELSRSPRHPTAR